MENNHGWRYGKVNSGVDSSTGLLGLIGWPVHHSISPRIHNAAFKDRKLNLIYLSFPVPSASLASALAGARALGLVGLNVTYPHKQAVVPLLDDLSEEAKLIGAVNTIHIQQGRATGYNTDGRGLLAALRAEQNFDLRGRRILVIGAGGAGRAISVQAALSGAELIYLADRETERAVQLAHLINTRISEGRARVLEMGGKEWETALREVQLVVDATPLGMKPDDPKVFDPGLLSPSSLVVDLVYNPAETALLKEVRRRGITGMNGLGMLVHQAALSWEIWTGRKAPLQLMKETALEALSGKKLSLK